MKRLALIFLTIPSTFALPIEGTQDNGIPVAYFCSRNSQGYQIDSESPAKTTLSAAAEFTAGFILQNPARGSLSVSSWDTNRKSESVLKFIDVQDWPAALHEIRISHAPAIIGDYLLVFKLTTDRSEIFRCLPLRIVAEELGQPASRTFGDLPNPPDLSNQAAGGCSLRRED